MRLLGSARCVPRQHHVLREQLGADESKLGAKAIGKERDASPEHDRLHEEQVLIDKPSGTQRRPQTRPADIDVAVGLGSQAPRRRVAATASLATSVTSPGTSPNVAENTTFGVRSHSRANSCATSSRSGSGSPQ